jgi:hypothetical protein
LRKLELEAVLAYDLANCPKTLKRKETMIKFYAFNVEPGTELDSLAAVKNLCPPALASVPLHVMRNKKQGRLEGQLYPVFKGLIFVQAEESSLSAVEENLRLNPPSELSEEDRALLERLGSSPILVFRLYADPEKNYQLSIQDGPLMGFEDRVTQINPRKGRLRLALPLLGKQWEVDFSYETPEQDFMELTDKLRRAGYILNTSGKALNPAIAAFTREEIKGVNWDRLWEEEFGNEKEARDFAGRTVQKESHSGRSAFSWDIDYIDVQGNKEDRRNWQIAHVETIKQRAGRNQFWIGRRLYNVSRIPTEEKLNERRLAPYPYKERGKKYALFVVMDLDSNCCKPE